MAQDSSGTLLSTQQMCELPTQQLKLKTQGSFLDSFFSSPTSIYQLASVHVSPSLCCQSGPAIVDYCNSPSTGFHLCSLQPVPHITNGLLKQMTLLFKTPWLPTALGEESKVLSTACKALSSLTPALLSDFISHTTTLFAQPPSASGCSSVPQTCSVEPLSLYTCYCSCLKNHSSPRSLQSQFLLIIQVSAPMSPLQESLP